MERRNLNQSKNCKQKQLELIALAIFCCVAQIRKQQYQNQAQEET